MQAIGLLMIEHRVIERMLKLMENEFAQPSAKINIPFIELIVDFFRHYADENHHGKEEDILFRALTQKKLSNEHQRIMGELLHEHAVGRNLVKQLENSKKHYASDDQSAAKEIFRTIRSLLGLYPKHIEKENKHFFIPSLDYFNDDEKIDLLNRCREFNKKFKHNEYIFKIAELEKKYK